MVYRVRKQLVEEGFEGIAPAKAALREYDRGVKT
jgi:hypothetical protein